MTYRGLIRNGTAVFETPLPLPEGAGVRVEPATLPRGSAAALGSIPRPQWVGDPEEFDRLLEEIQRDRDADLSPG